MAGGQVWSGCALALILCGASGCGEEEAGSVEVGDGYSPLVWEGYVNEEADEISTNKPLTDYGTAALEASGRRFALLHTSETF